MKPFFKYLKSISLLCAFIITQQKINAQEICNNGIDDDDNGLIDLFDPGCQCGFKVTGNLLLNGSFEQYDHCPTTYLYNDDYMIADSWRFGAFTNYAEAYYYHNIQCAYDSQEVSLKMAPALPLPDGNGFISIQNISSVNATKEKDITKTYVTQCLQQPLKNPACMQGLQLSL